MKERVKFNNVLVGRRRVNSFLIGGKVSINCLVAVKGLKLRTLMESSNWLEEGKGLNLLIS